jgi:hypothetical protein
MVMQNKKNIEDYVVAMKQRMEIDSSELVGCTSEEVQALERKYNIILPDSYKSFLLKMGKVNHLVDINEYSIDYDSVLRMTEREIEVIDEVKREIEEEGLDETVTELPKNALLILGRCDGSQFYLIISEGGDDSPVYYYNSDDDVIKKEHDSFWGVLDMFLKGRIIG